MAPVRNTNYSNIVLEADVLLKIYWVEGKIRDDIVRDDNVIMMRVAESDQGCVACDHDMDELPFSRSNFMSKIDKHVERDYISALLSNEGLEVLCTGLDFHKMLVEINKTLLDSFESVQCLQPRPDETSIISNMQNTKEVLAQGNECMANGVSFRHTS